MLFVYFSHIMATSGANTRQKKKTLLTAVHDLNTAIKDVDSLAKEVRSHENWQREVSTLQTQLQEEQRNVQEEKVNAKRWKGKYSSLWDDLEERSALWIREKEEMKQQLKSCEENLKTSREATDTGLSQQIEALEETIDKKSQQIHDQETKITGLDTRFMRSTQHVEYLSKKIGWREKQPDL